MQSIATGRWSSTISPTACRSRARPASPITGASTRTSIRAARSIRRPARYTLSAYNNRNDRQNILNQTDWTYRFITGRGEAHGGVRHRVRQPEIRQRAVHRLLRQRHGRLGADLGARADHVPAGVLQRPGVRRQEQDQPRSRGRLHSGSDRADALAAVHRRRPVRPVRPELRQSQRAEPGDVRADSSRGSTIWSRRAQASW